MASVMKGTDYPMDTKFAQFDSKTGLFTSTQFKPQHIPDDMLIDQFMFEYTPEQAAKGGPGGEGHFRPDASKLTWLVDGPTGRQLSFSDVRSRTAQLSGVLHSHLGLANDDVVAIYSPNDVDYGPACWAAFRLGGIVSGANPSYTADELSYQLEVLAKTYKLKGFVTHPASLEVALKAAKKAKFPTSKILLVGPASSKPSSCPKDILTFEEAIAKYAPDPSKLQLPARPNVGKGGARKKLAFLSFSSGTTGLPKAVCIPHMSVISNVIQYNRGRDMTVKPGEKVLAVLPFYHIYGLVVILHASLYMGAACVVFPKFEFEPILDGVIKYNIRNLFVVPPMVVLLTKHPAVESRKDKLHKIMTDIMVGAAPLTEELVQAFRKRFPGVNISQGYGLTETSTVISMPARLQGECPGSSAGVLAPNVELKILSEDQKPLGFGETGEVCSRGPSNASGYLNNEEATKETFIDGFVHTGDEGFVDEKGWLYVVDRRKELIKVKGNQVAPAELEGHLLGHPDVADACVIGVPNEFAGEVPRAYIVPSSSAAEKIKNDKEGKAEKELSEGVKKWVSDKKIKYKWLEGGVEFVDAIPKNPSGKLLRRQLRDQYKARTQKSKL